MKQQDLALGNLAPAPTRIAATAAVLVLVSACGGGGQTTVTVDEEADVNGIEPVGGIAPLDDAPAPVTGDEPEVAAAAPGDGWQALQSDWASSIETVQARFGELTEEELLGTGGDRDQLVQIVQEKYNLDLVEAEKQVNDFEAAL